MTGEVSEIQMLLEKYFNVYEDRIGLEKCLPRQQDKCRERHEQAAINAPASRLDFVTVDWRERPIYLRIKVKESSELHQNHPRIIHLLILGAVHKVCHAPRGGRGSEKVWQFVTGGRGGVKIVWRHTFNFFHNSQFYVLFHISSYIIKI